jgi:hypothetical protein
VLQQQRGSSSSLHHANQFLPLAAAQRVENYEYEMPSDFEDEEIDEDLAFTAEDKKKYAGWFGEEPDDDAGAGSSGDEQQGSKKRARREFADLDSSEEEEPEDDEDEVGASSISSPSAIVDPAMQSVTASRCRLQLVAVLQPAT